MDIFSEKLIGVFGISGFDLGATYDKEAFLRVR
jgi:hypothetical protein